MNLLKRVAALVPALAIIALCAVPQYGYAQPAPVPRNDVGQTGNITYQTGTVVLGLNADSTCSIEVAGTFVGTLQFQGAIAAGSAFALPSLPVSGTASVTTTTGTGRWFTGCGGLSQISVVATAWTSGKATVTLIGSMGSNFSSIGNAALSTVAQGTAAASSASWPFFLFGLSGTNQADVDSSHRMLTLASQSGSPWGVSCTAANCTMKLSDGSNTAGVDVNTNLRVVLCGTISGTTCAQGFGFTTALGPTNGGIATLSELYGTSISGSSVVPVVTSPLRTGLLANTSDSIGATVAVTCDKSASVNISTATTTSIVAASGSTKIYVCGYDLYVVSGTTPGFKFVHGPGAACVTTPVDFSGVYGGIAGAVGQRFEHGTGVGAVLTTAASDAFCITSSGTTPNIQGYVQYAQF